MTVKKQKNPLYGLKMDTLLTDISDHYGWICLSETLNIERFQFHTGLKSTIKFLRNNQWAKEKVENFYLYQYKNFSWPDDKQLSLPPRDRSLPEQPQATEPKEITEDVIKLFERASRLRSYKIAENNSDKQDNQKEEPAYDPSNPWNK